MAEAEIVPIERPKRQRKRLQTPNPEVRQRLMDAAAELILDGRYDDLRIEDITDHAGLSVGTFYLYFRGKSDLFIHLVLDYTERLRARVREARESGEGPIAARLSRGLDAYIDFVLENEQGFISFANESGTMSTNAGILSSWAFNLHAEDLRPYLEAAIEAGEMRPLDTVLTSQALVGLAQHMMLFWLANKDTYTREQIKSFLDIFGAFGVAPLERRSQS
jgi:AcrR family transcriptional regulator